MYNLSLPVRDYCVVKLRSIKVWINNAIRQKVWVVCYRQIQRGFMMNKNNDYPLMFKGVLVESDQFGDYYIDGMVTSTKDMLGDCPLFKGAWFSFDIINYDELSKFTNNDLNREFKAKAIASLIEIHNDWVELRNPPEPINQQSFRYCFE